jgi:hypothetical protein
MATVKAEAHAAKIDFSKTKYAAVTAGRARAKASGLTKDYDVAVCIMVELDKAGLKIVRKPSKDGLREFGRRVGSDNVTVAGMREASK